MSRNFKRSVAPLWYGSRAFSFLVLLTLLSSIVLFSGNLVAQTMNRRSTLLLRSPDIHGDQIVFQYGDDLWTAQSDGTHARA
ncbi:MAG: hypothetical protein WCC59_03435, partial [Terriglobales bacterium]